MKQFVKNLLSKSDDVSHKRIIAIIAMLVLVGFAVSNQFGIKTDPNLIVTFASIAGGESVLTVIDKFIK